MKHSKHNTTFLLIALIIAVLCLHCQSKPTLKDKIAEGKITEPITLIHKRPALVQGVHGNKSGLSLRETNNYGISFMEIKDTLIIE